MTEKKRKVYLNAINSGLFLVHNHGVDIPAQYDGDGSLILSLGRFAEVHQPASHTCVLHERSRNRAMIMLR